MLDRNYIDGEIKKGRFASYGHCLRYFVHSDKVQKRELSRLRADNARLKGILEVVQDKHLYYAEQVLENTKQSEPKEDY